MVMSEYSSAEERHVYTVNVVGSNPSTRTSGCSTTVVREPSKLLMRVRFPLPAPVFVLGVV